MAGLSGLTIAATYDRLLALPSGGLNGTSLVAITDGDTDTACSLSVATDSIAVAPTHKIRLDGNSSGNTYILESAADIMDFYAGGSLMLNLDKTNGEIVINEGGADLNFRVEGTSSKTHLLFCDAGNNLVGIGTSSPSQNLTVASTSSPNIEIKNSNTTTGSGTDIGVLQWAHSDSHADASNLVMGRILVEATQAVVANDDSPSAMRFSVVKDAEDTLTETLTLYQGSVGIGAPTPDTNLHVWDGDAGAISLITNAVAVLESAAHTRLQLNSPDSYSPGIYFNSPTYQSQYAIHAYLAASGTGNMQFEVSDSIIMTLKGGQVGIGTASPQAHKKLDVQIVDNESGAGMRVFNNDGYIVLQNGTGATGGFAPQINCLSVLAASETAIIGNNATDSGTVPILAFRAQANSTTVSTRPLFQWRNDSASKMTMLKDGYLIINHASQTNPAGNDVDATAIGPTQGINSNCTGVEHKLGRGEDGDIVSFYSAGGAEGAIAISGSSTSLTGFSGNHESSGIDSNTDAGTVVSAIDELDTYIDDAHPKKGQVRENHPKVKISDSVGDKRIFGVVSKVPAQDGKVLIDAVGISAVRVTGTCEGGDLLESNGDGTAKVQSDDIIKSKTIGKVTIGNSGSGVKLVSCVLYCG